MKKNKKIILIFISVITLIIIVTAAVLIIKPNNEKYKKHYKITYSASYNTAKVLENDKQYEIVSDQDRFQATYIMKNLIKDFSKIKNY